MIAGLINQSKTSVLAVRRASAVSRLSANALTLCTLSANGLRADPDLYPIMTRSPKAVCSATEHTVYYAQEAGRSGRAEERVTASIIVEDKDWSAHDPKQDSCLELKTRRCRRSVLGRCLDDDVRDCRGQGAVRCDNCQRKCGGKVSSPRRASSCPRRMGERWQVGSSRLRQRCGCRAC